MSSIDDLLGSKAKGGKGFGHEAPVTGGTVEWYTPPWIFEALGLTFDLDPCAPQGGLPWIPAAEFYSLPDDGLKLPWQGRVWNNPPYGPATKLWLARMNEHRNGVSLVFARTDTDWFHTSAVQSDGILFLKKRLKFVDRTGKPPLVWDKKAKKYRESGAGAGSMLVAWGAECAAALRRMAQAGGGLFVEPSMLGAADGLEDLL